MVLPGNKTFSGVDSMVVSWWIVAFLRCDDNLKKYPHIETTTKT